jgi:hypothetical protein
MEIHMKKLCKLFWKNDILGKWILYNSDTKQVLEVKKFDKDGNETHVNLLEQAMLDKGILELDHSIKIWEVELVLSETPALPRIDIPNVDPPTPNQPGIFDQTNPNWPNIITTDRTWPIQRDGGIVYGGGSTTFTTTFGGVSITPVIGEGTSQVNGYATNMSYVAAATMPKDVVLAVNANSHNKFLAAINHLAVEKNYRREDEEVVE